MDLLTNAEKLEIKAAFKDVTDTFYKTPVVYLNMSEPFSRFGNRDNATATRVNLLCRTTVKDTEGNAGIQTLEGIDDAQEIEFRFNAADLRAANVMDGLDISNVKISVHKDYMEYNGRQYLVDMISTDDTDFAGELIIIVVNGKRQPIKA